MGKRGAAGPEEPDMIFISLILGALLFIVLFGYFQQGI
jgi:hypothetical protein